MKKEKIIENPINDCQFVSQIEKVMWSLDNFLSINFINKKAKQFLQNLSHNDAVHLLKKLSQGQNSKNEPNEKSSLYKLPIDQIKKVAVQVQFLGYDKDYCMIFGIYGPNIDRNNKDSLIFCLTRIIQQSFYNNSKSYGEAKGLKKYSTQGVSLVFFNKSSVKKRNKIFLSSKQKFEPIKIDDFKSQVIRQLTLKHLIKINHIVLIYPSLLTKSLNFFTSFGIQNGFYDKYFTNFDSIYQLVNFLGPLFEVNKINQNFLSQDSTSSKNWKTIYSEQYMAHSFNDFKSYQKLCEQSSVDNLENCSQYRYKDTFHEYLLDKDRGIPLILSYLYSYVLQNHLYFQGLFRKVPGETQLARFQNFILCIQEKCIQMENKQDAFLKLLKSNIGDFEVQCITAYIKKLFMELQHPIISFETYAKINQLSQNDLETFLNGGLMKSMSFQNTSPKPFKQKDNLVNMSFSVPNAPSQRGGNVSEKINYFQNLSRKNNIIFTVIDQKPLIIGDKNSTNRKISFKKVQNGKKSFLFQNIQSQQKDLLNLDEMKLTQPVEYNTLKQTIMFLSKIKASEKFNLMSAQNLAICFNPCLFRKSQISKVQVLTSVHAQCDEQVKFVRILSRLIEKPEIFFEID